MTRREESAKISGIVYDYNLKNDLEYNFYPNGSILHSAILGSLFDRVYLHNDSIPHNIKIEEFVIPSLPVSLTDESCSNNSLSQIQIQADSFIKLTMELNPIDESSFRLVEPTFLAISYCLSTEWRPQYLDKKFLLTLLELMLLQENLKYENNTGFDILLKLISKGFHQEISDMLLDFLPRNYLSYTSSKLLIDSITIIIKDQLSILIPQSIHQDDFKLPPKELKSLEHVYNLGDEVQVFDSDEWILSKIVKINAITKEYSIEPNIENGKTPTLLKLAFTSSLIRKPIYEEDDTQGPSPTKIFELDSVLRKFKNEFVSQLLPIMYLSSAFPESGNNFPVIDEFNEFSIFPPRCSQGHLCNLSIINSFKCSQCSQQHDTKVESILKSQSIHLYCWNCYDCNSSICFDCSPYYKKVIRKTLCFLGDSCQPILTSPHIDAEILDTLFHGSILEIIDNPELDYYQISNGQGYVHKIPPGNSIWKEIQKDRYGMTNNIPLNEEFIESLASQLSSNTYKFLEPIELIDIWVKYINVLKQQTLSYQKTKSIYFDKQEDDLANLIDTLHLLIASNIKLKSRNCEEFNFRDDLDDLDLSNLSRTGSIFDNIQFLHCFLPASTSLPAERLALFTAEILFTTIVNKIDLQAERLQDDLENQFSLSDSMIKVYQVIHRIFHSDHRAILIPVFFRPLLTRLGIKIKAMTLDILNNPDLTFSYEVISEILLTLDYYDSMAKTYIIAIFHPILDIPFRFKYDFIRKLYDTVHSVGHCALINGILSKCFAKSDTSNEVSFEMIIPNENIIFQFTSLQQFFHLLFLSSTPSFSSSNSLVDSALNIFKQFLYQCNRYCDVSSLEKIEDFWRNSIITEYLYDQFLQIYHTHIVHSKSIETYEASSRIVQGLYKLLTFSKESTHNNMGGFQFSSYNANLAFEKAFSRLSKDLSLSFTKIMVIYISSLLDTSRTNNRSNDAFDDDLELIEILFNQSSDEFQHFYEILLARRLLKSRYLTICTELRMLQILPAMSKASQMIHDILESQKYLDLFKKDLVEQIDYLDLQISDDVLDVVMNTDSFSVQMLTASVWSKPILQPLQYSSLIYPSDLSLIREKYTTFYLNQNDLILEPFQQTQTMNNSPRDLASSFSKAYLIQTTSDLAYQPFNGLYIFSRITTNNHLIYEHINNINTINHMKNKLSLEFNYENFTWSIKTVFSQSSSNSIDEKERETVIAYCQLDNPSQSLLYNSMPWKILKRHKSNWYLESISIVEVDDISSYVDKESFLLQRINSNNSMAFETLNQQMFRKKYLIWCPAAGFMVLEALWDCGFKLQLNLTEPQALLLLLFNHDTPESKTKIYWSYKDLKIFLGLKDTELNLLLKSLSNKSFPVIQRLSSLSDEVLNNSFTRSFQNSDVFALSDYFITKEFIETSNSKQFVKTISSNTLEVELDPQSLHNGENESDQTTTLDVVEYESLVAWRNELIDACIVRLLKRSFVQKLGEFGDEPTSSDKVSLSLDTLLNNVKKSLQTRCDVSLEDVVRRCEHLTNSGIINKIAGDRETFRSVAYCYLQDIGNSNLEDSTPKQSLNYYSNLTKVTGPDLFDHIRMIFHIQRLPFDENGISFPLLRRKFISWILQSPCNISPESNRSQLGMQSANTLPFPSSNILDIILKLLFNISEKFILQINSLKLQYLYEFSSSEKSFHNFQSNPFASLATTQRFIKLIDLINSLEYEQDFPGFVSVTFLLMKMSKIFLLCLPLELIRAIIYYFKSITKSSDSIHFKPSSVVSRQSKPLDSFPLESDDLDPMNTEDDIDYFDSLYSSISPSAKISQKFSPLKSPKKKSSRNLLHTEIINLWSKQGILTQQTIVDLGIDERIIIDYLLKEISDQKYFDLTSRVTKEANSPKSNNNPIKALQVVHVRNTKKINFPIIITFEQFLNLIFLQVARDCIYNLENLEIRSDFNASSKISTIWKDLRNSPFCNFSQLLDFIYFHQLFEYLAKMFDVSLDFEDEDESEDDSEQDEQQVATNLSDETREAMIPCEFCNDNIEESLYAAHIFTNHAMRIIEMDHENLHRMQQQIAGLGQLPRNEPIPPPPLPRPPRLDQFIRQQMRAQQPRDQLEEALFEQPFLRMFNGQGLAANILRHEGLQEPRGPVPFPHLRAHPPIAAREILNRSTVNQESRKFNETEESTDPKLLKRRPTSETSLGFFFLESVVSQFLSITETLETSNNQTIHQPSILEENTEEKSIEMKEETFPDSSVINLKDEIPESILIKPIETILLDTFQLIDKDKDGYLTSNDFSPHNSFEDTMAASNKTSSLHDHSLLDYNIKSDKLLRSPMKKLIYSPHLSKISENQEDLPSQSFSTPINFQKSDSLWLSVSNQKSLMNAQTSRSYCGLNETEAELWNFVDRASSILAEPEATSVALLLFYKWNLKLLVEEYLENSRLVRMNVGLSPKSRPSFHRFDIFLDNEYSKEEIAYATCSICQDDTVEKQDAYALTCLHWYCKDCWENYIRIQISDRNLNIRCPCAQCNYLVTMDMQNFFVSEEFMSENNKNLVKSFVEEKRGQRVVASYCKNPKGCPGIVLLAEDALSCDAICSFCKSSFCSACDMPPHSPATCDMISKWEERGGYLETGNLEEVEARRLKHLTTRPCPKCGVRIEKNGGCPHMICIQPTCKYHFCWDCSGEYHTSSVCTRSRVKSDSNSILAFDYLDRQCTSHFSAKQISTNMKYKYQKLMMNTDIKTSELHLFRLLIEAWSIIIEGHSALAHTCIVLFSLTKSAKLEFLYAQFKTFIQTIHQKLDEISRQEHFRLFPLHLLKNLIREIKIRKNDFVLMIQAEILPSSSQGTNLTNSTKKSKLSSRLLSPPRNRPRTSTVSNLSTPMSPLGQLSSQAKEEARYNQLIESLNHGQLNTRDKELLSQTTFGNAFGGSNQIFHPNFNTFN